MHIRTDHNVQRRVTLRAGWLGMFSGESMGSATAREVKDLNRDGYRVAFMIPDRWSFGRRVLNTFLWLITLGFVGYQEGVLIIGELGDDQA